MRNFSLSFVLTALLCAGIGCAPMMKHDPELSKAGALIHQKKFTEAAETYRKMLTPQTSGDRDAMARYSLGLLYAYYDNPQRDYNQAIVTFDDFLQRYPNHEHAAEAQNWRSTIKLIQEEAREKDQLKKSIEQLKKLDIRHEEKRKEK